MTKELTPLEALERIKKWFPFKVNELEYQNICIIETALKRLEQIETTTRSVLREDISKKLKALEIIKEKMVNVFIFLHSGDLETYNDMVEDNRKLTQEEYDLLKEVLL